jgi:hypothetical protein
LPGKSAAGTASSRWQHKKAALFENGIDAEKKIPGECSLYGDPVKGAGWRVS